MNTDDEEEQEGSVRNLRIHFIRTRNSIRREKPIRTLLLWEELTSGHSEQFCAGTSKRAEECCSLRGVVKQVAGLP